MSRPTRREFVAGAASCAAHLALASSVLPAAARALWAQPVGPLVAREPFGRLEKVADGVWALISTPLDGDRTTLCNGGIIAGRNGVLAIEGYNTPAGAQWLAAQAHALTGKWPTHVVATHYHADHANGLGGYRTDDHAAPVIHVTAPTRELVLAKNLPADPSRSAALADAELLPTTAPTVLDLGGRSVRIVPRLGHTASDCTIELEEPSVLFGGDLLWNGMFPNYVDAQPRALRRAVQAVRAVGAKVMVPGHGAVATADDIARYVAVLDEVEGAARAAHAKGLPAGEAGAAFALPPSLGTWTLFNKVFFPRAFEAWYKDLAG